MNGHAAAYSNFRRIEGSVTVSPAKFACQTSDMTGVAFCGDSRFGCPWSEARRITPQSVPSHVSQTPPARPPASGPSWHGCPESANKYSRSSRAGIEPARRLDSNTCEACLGPQNGRARHGLHYILPHPNTQRALENIPGLIIVAMEVQGSDPSRRPRRSARVLPLGDHEICPHGPNHISRKRRCSYGRTHAQMLKLHFPIFPYFAASCAHFASVVRKEFAAAGGSTSPVNAALNVIMCP